MRSVTTRHEGTHAFDAVNVKGSISQGGNKILASVYEINKLRGIDTSSGAKMVQALTATVTHADATAKDLFTIPTNAMLIGFQTIVTEAFDDTGTDLLDIGLKGTGGNHYASAMDVSTTGLKTPNYTNLGVVGANTTITATFTGQNSDATKGSAVIIALYLMP
jgi:hypothetical protein